jgi:hypothetical protein
MDGHVHNRHRRRFRARLSPCDYPKTLGLLKPARSFTRPRDLMEFCHLNAGSTSIHDDEHVRFVTRFGLTGRRSSERLAHLLHAEHFLELLVRSSHRIQAA